MGESHSKTWQSTSGLKKKKKVHQDNWTEIKEMVDKGWRHAFSKPHRINDPDNPLINGKKDIWDE